MSVPISYHGRYLSVGLQVLDNLALVCRLDAREQSRVSYGLGLVVGAEVVELSPGERLAIGSLRLREHADTTADRLGRRLSPRRDNTSRI